MTMEEKIDLILEKMIKVDMIDMLVEKVGVLEKDMKELRKEQDNTNKTLNVVQKDIKELRQDHENMNRALILIEDDTSNKIPALFDGYSFHQQHIEEDEKRLDILENEVDEHSIRISALEQVN
ncbi:MAG: hypothetical protein HFJ30_02560 [Clostridia bacterium]|nr:hypothetical protein [Clostridia bacterium]